MEAAQMIVCMAMVPFGEAEVGTPLWFAGLEGVENLRTNRP
jgi:hypothetical protein